MMLNILARYAANVTAHPGELKYINLPQPNHFVGQNVPMLLGIVSTPAGVQAMASSIGSVQFLASNDHAETCNVDDVITP